MSINTISFFDNGLFMYNEQERLRVSLLYPEFGVLDMRNLSKTDIERELDISYQNQNQHNQHNQNIHTNQNKISIAKVNNAKNYRPTSSSSEHHQGKQMATEKTLSNNNFDKTNETRTITKESQTTRSNLANEPFETNNLTLKKFISDKKSYQQIKLDIERGYIKKEEINPLFMVTYQLMKLLDDRSVIDFSSNHNIRKEFADFSILSNEFAETECSSEDSENVPPKSKVFVPHNYHFLSLAKKEEFAKKYKMTREKFEQLYVDIPNDDGEPDGNNSDNRTSNTAVNFTNHNNGVAIAINDINDINTLVNKSIGDFVDDNIKLSDVELTSTSNTESTSGSDSVDDSDSPRKIDEKFIELMSQYNSRLDVPSTTILNSRDAKITYV